jgi:hypothetical protein
MMLIRFPTDGRRWDAFKQLLEWRPAETEAELAAL